ncbi:MAG: U32 family peptidase [Oscillospiraceae bacterium]|jgi:putative protease
MKKKPELLSPAGDFESLQEAVRYGANAVYLAGKEFGMRAASKNFGDEELIEAVQFAHAHGVKVYLTCNTIPRNEELQRIPKFLEKAQDAGVDAFIMTDFGVMEMAKKYAPKVALHISTQAGVANYATANAFYHLGASRVVLARELSIPEIKQIRAHIPEDLEIECFVHGAMCVSFSGRCLLSNYLTGRDANRGACAQPCRWKYALCEETRPGKYFPIEEDKDGTYLLNSKDMCMIDYLPQLLEAGVTSLKIEGRAKSPYYVAAVTNAYRRALEDAVNGTPLTVWAEEELHKISHREYSHGFYLGQEPGQNLGSGGYVREYEVIAVCESYENGTAVLKQRNRFFAGETADVMEPGKAPYLLPLTELYDENGEPLQNANHAEMKVLLKTEIPIAPGAFLRHKLS